MATFRRRPEIVDARQFTGGVQNGTDICLWVNSNHGGAYWWEKRVVGGRILAERIRLYPSGSDYALVWIGDWIVHRQDGTWEALRPEDLHEEYEEV